MLKNKKVYKKLGLTLIELMVTIAILLLLLLTAIPLVDEWIYSAQTREARSKLIQAYGSAKALALRNPTKAILPNSAAGLRIVTSGTTSTLLVCKGNPTDTACAVNGTNFYSAFELPSNVGVAIAGVTATSSAPQIIGITNRGIPISTTTYTVSRGGIQNNESGILY